MAVVEAPCASDLVERAQTLRRGEPQLAFVVELHRPHVGRSPAAVAVARQQAPPDGVGTVPQVDAGGRGGCDPDRGIGNDLADFAGGVEGEGGGWRGRGRGVVAIGWRLVLRHLLHERFDSDWQLRLARQGERRQKQSEERRCAEVHFGEA